MCCALWGTRIMMIITCKFPVIRNDTSSRLYPKMFSTVGAVWHAEEGTSRWAPCITRGDCMHNIFVYAGEMVDQKNCVSGSRGILNCAHYRYYLSHLPTLYSATCILRASCDCDSPRMEVSPNQYRRVTKPLKSKNENHSHPSPIFPIWFS